MGEEDRTRRRKVEPAKAITTAMAAACTGRIACVWRTGRRDPAECQAGKADVNPDEVGAPQAEQWNEADDGRKRSFSEGAVSDAIRGGKIL